MLSFKDNTMNRTLKSFLCLLLLLCLCPYSYSQEATSYVIIQGQVIDAEVNMPLTGATVVLKDSNIGTATDENGYFNLAVPADAGYFIVSFVGKEPVTLKVRPKGGKYKIMLKDDTQQTEDVVVTGYRTISKTRMTGATETITSEKIENKGDEDYRHKDEHHRVDVGSFAFAIKKFFHQNRPPNDTMICIPMTRTYISMKQMSRHMESRLTFAGTFAASALRRVR